MNALIRDRDTVQGTHRLLRAAAVPAGSSIEHEARNEQPFPGEALIEGADLES
jgi:hypothetical protein